MKKITLPARTATKKLFLVTAVFLFLFAGDVFCQPPIDLSKPVGMVAGQAGSNGVGAATYTVPIDIPAGIKDVQPQVSITYSSQGAGNGFSGNGWSLTGLSMISRAGKDVFHNGIATPVAYTGANDAFVLDGQRLMLISGTNGADGSIYGTEQESFSKIEGKGGLGNSPTWFKVTTKNGTVMEYGSDNTQIKTVDGNNVMFWLLRRVTDAAGNYMLYNYSIDNTNRYFTLNSINYTGNTGMGVQPGYQVVFTYSTRTDYQSSPVYLSGSHMYNAKILDRIDVKKSDGTPIRSYNFTYQYRHKKYFLMEVEQKGADGTALNPVTFSYGNNTTAPEVSLSADITYSTDQNYTGDFDGDGRTDVQTYAYTINTSNGDIQYKWYQIYDYEEGQVGGKYTYNMETDITDAYVKVLGKDAAQNPFAISDFDGDGKEDVILAKFDKSNSSIYKGLNINYSRVYPWFGTNPYSYEYKKMAYDQIPTSFYGQHKMWKKGGSFFVTGDFDGDGYVDYILILGIQGYSNAYKAFLSTPAKQVFNEEILSFGVGVNGATGEFAAEMVAEAKSIIPINFDGDAKTELLVVRDEGSYVISVFPVPATSGYRYGSSVLYTTPDIKTDYRIFPADFNGDGNTDLFVRPSKDNSAVHFKIFMSTGKTFIQSEFHNAYRMILPGDGYSNGHMVTIGDFDGDGKSDIWHSLDLTTSSSRHVIYYMDGFTTSYTYESSDFNKSTNSELMYSGGDFNGDGKPDLLPTFKVSNTSILVKFLMAKPFREQNLLVGASTLGYQTQFKYALLNGKDNYTPSVYSRTMGEINPYDNSLPVPNTPAYIVPAPAMYAIAKISRPSGSGSYFDETYNYQDLVLHTQGRGFLGFKRTDVTNQMNLVSRSWFEVNTDYSMLYPDVTQVHAESSGILTRSRYTTSFKYVSASPYTNRRFFMKTDRVHTKNWLTNEAQEVLNTYDDYGNITESTVHAGSSDDFNITSVIETVVTSTTYGTYAGAPYPGFPTSITSTTTRTGQAAVTGTTNTSYTAQGLPLTVTKRAGTALATTVTNTYNGFGLPTQVITNAPGVTTPVVQYTYDSKGLFVLEKKVTGGGITKKETATFDERWQTPLSRTTTDGLTTTYQYNTFGEPVQTNLPDGNAITTTKSWETTGSYRYSVLTQRTDGSSPVKAYFDILGRELKTEERAFNNKWLTTTRSFNSYGQLNQKAVPYYPGESVNYHSYTYDVYGRQIYQSSNTGSTITNYIRDGNTSYTVKTTNAKGQWTSQTTDATGRVIGSSDNGVDMEFTYDSWGNQLTAKSNGQTFVTHVYDSYGRKQSTTDVNAGTITYEYNSLDQIIKQTDAKNQDQQTTYDVFGRVASATGPQGTTTYTYYYDAGSQKSNDNLTEVTGFGGDVRTYQYDALQRLSSETMTTGSTSLTKSYTYDTHGNLATTTYPAGFLIRNVYNGDDVLTQTKYEQGSTSKTLFTATDMNSRGIYTGYSTGNGKTKSVTYNFTREAPTRYYTAGVQDLNLVYEANTQNLLSREDAIRNLTETFTYDTYDRLTNAKVNTIEQFSMSYDAGAQGKIMQKTDIGNYVYDNQKIHQLKYLTTISGGGTDPTVVIGTDTRELTYTAFLKTASITEGDYELSYTYGSDQQRLTSTLKHNGTTIEEKLYWGDVELQTKGGTTREIYYIAAGNGLNNIIVKQGSTISIYYTYTDQLGSIVAVTNEAGTIVAEQNFDAWGRYRNPADWSYTGVPANPDWLYRGFTGHEHITVMALINMNGRMYDPMTGLMLSPDNYTPMPFSPGGYNRYIYANGNPLKFVDPDGEFFQFVLGALISVVTNGVSNLANNRPFFKGAVKAALIGGIGGQFAYAIGNVAQGLSGFSKVAFSTFAHGSLGGMMSVASGGSFGQGFLSGSLGSLGGAGAMSLTKNISSKALRGVSVIGTGTLFGGIGAEVSGGNFWDGARNGAISSGLNHAVHSGIFGEGLAVAAKTNRIRHVFGPDAVAIAGGVDGSSGTGLKASAGMLRILRGSYKGSYGYIDGGAGVGGVSVSAGIEKVNLYTSTTTEAISLDNFYGPRYEMNIGFDVGVGIGLSLAYSTFDGGYTIGVGQSIGIGASASLISFSINKGLTVGKVSDLPSGVNETMKRW